jgi:hypothetical protein
MITKDTLGTMNAYEKNCAVNMKVLRARWPDAKSIELDERQKCHWVQHIGFTSWPIEDYCSVPNAYMKLAIEYGITIYQDIENQQVSCIAYQKDLIGGEKAIMSRIYPNNKTGEAVAGVFLMLEVLK